MKPNPELCSDSPWGLYADVYDLEFNASWTARDLPLYLREAQKRRGPVLELACGSGRLAIPLARAGHSVVGLDASPEMLALAREKAPDLTNLQLLEGRMQDFQLHQHFGLIFIALGSFYDLRSLEAQEGTLRAIRSHLHPQGRLIIDLFLPTPDYVGRAVALEQPVDLSEPLEVGCFTHPRDGRIYRVLEAAHHLPHQQTFTIQRVIQTLAEDGRQLAPERLFRICGRYVHRYEMLHLLRLCGFGEVELYGDYDNSPYQAESKRMIWMASI